MYFPVPASGGEPEQELTFKEAWSDAARAAAANARKYRGKEKRTYAQKVWTRNAYLAFGGKERPVRKAARQFAMARTINFASAKRVFDRQMERQRKRGGPVPSFTTYRVSTRRP